MTRRALIRTAGVGAAAVALGGCAANGPAADPGAGPAPRAERPMTGSNRRLLLAYFSRPGENYWYGGRRNLRVGNTETLTGMITDRIDCDVYRIEPTEPYPSDYDDTVARNVREQDQDARPGIAEPLPDVDGYDIILLAGPIWNVRPPMIMRTLIDGVDLAGKTILPITTHAMSGLGRAATDYAAAVPGAILGTGLAVRGEEVGDAGDQLDQWISSTRLRLRTG